MCTADLWTTWGLGAVIHPPPQLKIHVKLWLPKSLIANSLLLTGGFTKNTKSINKYFVRHMYCMLYSYNIISQRKENVFKKIIRENTLTVLYCVFWCRKFMLPVYKMTCLSVPMSILSYMIQNTRCINNTRHQKWKPVKLICIYRSTSSCTDNEEAAIWLLFRSLVHGRNRFMVEPVHSYGSQVFFIVFSTIP